MTLTNREARRFLLLKHGLIGSRRFTGKRGINEFVRQVGCIQFDPVDICGRNAELVLQSRVQNFTKRKLWDVLYKDHSLLDYFDKQLSIIPAEDWPCFARSRRANAEWVAGSYPEVPPAKEAALAAVHALGCASSRDLSGYGGCDFNRKVDWSWSPTRLSRAVLEALYFEGELVIHHKQGSNKFYALARDILPAQLLHAPDPNETIEDYHAWAVSRRIGAVGLLPNGGSDAWLGIGWTESGWRQRAFQSLLERGEIQEVVVEGTPAPLYCRTADLEWIERSKMNRLVGRTELIAPLDCLMWDRKLIQSLFGFDYKWEVYTPAARRKYGHYVLPILHGERFAGRAELVCDRRSGILLVRNVWPEAGVCWEGKIRRDFAACLDRFAAFNGCAAWHAEGSCNVDLQQEATD